MMSTCQLATDERKNCTSQFDYTVEGQDGILNCFEYCLQDCKNVGSNILSHPPQWVQFKLDNGELIPDKPGKRVNIAVFAIYFEESSDRAVGWRWSNDGWDLYIGSKFRVQLDKLSSQGIKFDAVVDTVLTTNMVVKSFCRILSSIPIGISVKLRVNLIIEQIPGTFLSSISQIIFPQYPNGKYIYKSGGWKVDGSRQISARIEFTKNSQIFDFPDSSSSVFPSYDDLMGKINPIIPERSLDLSHYISKTAKARVLDDVKFCNNPKEFFTQDEIDEISEENIITFILRSKKKSPLVICLDKDSLFDFWKLEESGQSWVFGRCQNKEEPHNCNRFYKIPGDITLLIDEAAKNAVIELWDSQNHYTMFELAPLEKVNIGRNIHYVGEASGEHTIYDVIPVAMYVLHK